MAQESILASTSQCVYWAPIRGVWIIIYWTRGDCVADRPRCVRCIFKSGHIRPRRVIRVHVRIFLLFSRVDWITATIDPRVCAGSQHRAGKDAARAFATGCFKEHQTHDIRELNEDELRVREFSHVLHVFNSIFHCHTHILMLQSLNHWKNFFASHKDYPQVGKVVHPWAFLPSWAHCSFNALSRIKTYRSRQPNSGRLRPGSKEEEGRGSRETQTRCFNG